MGKSEDNQAGENLAGQNPAGENPTGEKQTGEKQTGVNQTGAKQTGVNPTGKNSAEEKRARAKAAQAAFLNINKPKGITSHDVISRVRKIAGIKQVGHAGTLDPMAEGVLTVALGKACRLLRFLPDDKVYKAVIRLGITTDTDDIEGKTLSENPAATTNPPRKEAVQAALADFKGDIEQIPPYYSAIHVDGKRLYEMARSGQAPPELKPRPVTIHSIELLDYSAPDVTIRVHCSRGTYIRSIARDLGEKLGLGGTLAALVREASGRFILDHSTALDDPELMQKQVGIEKAIELPVLNLPPESAKRIAMGQKLDLADLINEVKDPQHTKEYLLLMSQARGKPFCVGRLDHDKEDSNRKVLAPEVVFDDV